MADDSTPQNPPAPEPMATEPKSPAESELREEALDSVAGGIGGGRGAPSNGRTLF